MRSTAVVLWLMILLVFVPIAAAHGIALYLQADPHPEVASIHPGAAAAQTVTR
ncbi:MAG: hypothetical protein JWQ36_1151 [Enterovirga sp.]|jgi:ABC-type Fe3+ transport system permease subunit|nr:hypothetical protein [Enterovirga sp.]